MGKKFKKTGGKFLAIFSIVICFGVCVCLADLFSSFITVGNFNNSNASKTSGFEIFAVSLYESKVKSSAIEYSASIQKIGGAGYVWQDGETFYVFASAYGQENDANKVLESLKNSGYTPSVVKLSFEKISLQKTYTNDEISVLNSALNIFKNTYDALYDISVSLDTNVFSQTQARLEIANLQSDITKIKGDFEALFNAKLTTTLLKLKLSLNSVNTLVSQLIDFNETENQTFSSKIKYNYLETLSLQQTLHSNAPNI